MANIHNQQQSEREQMYNSQTKTIESNESTIIRTHQQQPKHVPVVLFDLVAGDVSDVFDVHMKYIVQVECC
jgi:hypothetical protein